MRPLPAGPVLAFYGDDFTGSTATMEVLTFAGLPTVLFLRAPAQEQLMHFAGCRAIGIAGIARSQSPAWMQRNLPPIYRTLAALGAPIVHYKVCSTFDSAPHVGSIGAAIDAAAAVFEGWVPLVVGAPAIGRYQAFGTLFAAAHGVGHRLDRHPVMARHPVTPMHEADILRHLSAQTGTPLGLVDFAAMKAGASGAQLTKAIQGGARVVALDVLDDETLIETGRLIWEEGNAVTFAVGSQGVQYALVAYWRSAGMLPPPPRVPPARRVERIAAASGSVSPITAGQIAYARARGFAPVRLDATAALDDGAWQAALGRAKADALAALGQGHDPLVFTAEGPDDPAVAALRTGIAQAGADAGHINDRIGAGLGQVLDAVSLAAGLRRCVIAGGDTSGHAALAMGIHALTALAPVAPGAPLCLSHAEEAQRDGREIALKGGQMGAPDYFVACKG